MEKQIDMETTGDGDEPPEPTEPIITVTVDEAVDGVNAGWLETKTTSTLELLGKNQSQLAVRVVNDATMIQLHQDHSNISETTDVLTFDNGSTDASIHADIASCRNDIPKSTSNTSGLLTCPETPINFVP